MLSISIGVGMLLGGAYGGWFMAEKRAQWRGMHRQQSSSHVGVWTVGNYLVRIAVAALLFAVTLTVLSAALIPWIGGSFIAAFFGAVVFLSRGPHES